MQALKCTNGGWTQLYVFYNTGKTICVDDIANIERFSEDEKYKGNKINGEVLKGETQCKANDTGAGQ